MPEVAVREAEREEVVAQQLEVQRFLARHAGPVAVVRVGEAGEAPDRVEREIDRVQLDVRDRMQQRGATLDGAHAALAYQGVLDEGGAGRAARDADRLVHRDRGIEAAVVEAARPGCLAVRIGLEQQRERGGAQ